MEKELFWIIIKMMRIIYKYDLKNGDDGFDEKKDKINGKPICTKYTLKTKSCDIQYHFKNVEIYFCEAKNDLFVGTGK